MVTRAGGSDFEVLMRPGVHPERVVGKKVPPPPVHSETRENGLLIERNIRVRLRDGVHIYVDVYRPLGVAGEPALPALLGWSPYGKHN
jgi:predicted acyl esterase